MLSHHFCLSSNNTGIAFNIQKKTLSERSLVSKTFFYVVLFLYSVYLPLFQQKSFCPFVETLVPETYYVCVVYIRPKKEEHKVSEEGITITSELEENYSLYIPAGTFVEETLLSMQVLNICVMSCSFLFLLVVFVVIFLCFFLYVCLFVCFVCCFCCRAMGVLVKNTLLCAL